MSWKPWIIAKKEIREIIIRSKYILLTTVGMALLMGVVLPLIMTVLFLGGIQTTDPIPPEFAVIPEFVPGQASMTSGEVMFIFMIYTMIGTFHILVPAMLPIYIAADSFAGERERKTVEPLLTTPLSNRELLLGKILTSLIPSIIGSFGGYGATVAIINILSWPVFQMIIFPNFSYLLLELLGAPLIALAGILLMVIVSTKVHRVREASQVGGVVILPLMALMFGQIFGFIAFTMINVLFILGLIGIGNAAFYWLAIKIFNREKLVS
ncbi:MAG: ABC transporter permease subunit [Promethearchaeota archaeon]